MDDKFKEDLFEYKKKINKQLSIFFNNKILTKDNFEREYLKLLKEYSLRPAKRLRAILVNMGYLLAGGKNDKEILKTSIFVEILHNFLLIHDDIIDRDELRRGKETIHCYYRNKSLLRGSEREHFGQSMAIVLGDIANIIGYKILTDSNFNEKTKIKALKKINEIIEWTGKGQMLEMGLKEKMKRGEKIKEEKVIEVYKLKTAFYTFVLPLQAGAILAGASADFLKRIEKFALPLGIAFQLRDDLQEIFCSEKKAGKPIMSDIKEGQPNILIIKTLEKRREIKKYIGKTRINNKEAGDVRRLITESGSSQYCKGLIQTLTGRAEKLLLAERSFPERQKKFIINLAEYLKIE